MTSLERTRTSWHRVAEHVLAAAQYKTTGTIRLRPSDGGFETIAAIPGVGSLAVVGSDLVVRTAGSTASTPMTTLRKLADFAQVELGMPSTVYQPSTNDDPDEPLDIDPAIAKRLSMWLAQGDAALRAFAPDQTPVLWPEHLDLGIAADTVNYGVSLGDTEIPEPYLYVGPWVGRPSDDPFWNASFGATAGAAQIRSVDDAVAFFTGGRDRATVSPPV